jgi:putative tryptophan/tyrosine transport system substrate-binding protein
MGVYPFELDDSYPISAGFAHRCARGERLPRRADRFEIPQRSMSRCDIVPLHDPLREGRMASHIRRREFVAVLGTTAAWPLVAHAQQGGKLPIIGFLGSGDASTQTQWLAAFTQRLGEIGWIDGRTVKIEVRWAEGRNDRSAEITAKFVALKVDVIVTTGTPATAAAKHATANIPIVFVAVADPVDNGLVANLARPGGNLTGLSNLVGEVAAKRLELLHEAMPDLRRVAIMGNADNPGAVLEMRGAQGAAAKLGLEAVMSEIRRAEDIEPSFEALQGRVEAVWVAVDGLTIVNHNRINTFALVARLPTSQGIRELIDPGGMMSYGPNNFDLYRRAADVVDKILHGANPADIPVEQPTKFDLVVNLTTAKALGLKIPEPFLLLANEVIE